MATPTESEIQTQINHVVWLLHQSDLFLRSNTENVGGIYDDIIAAAEGDFVSFTVAGVDAFRAKASDLVSVRTARDALDGLFREYGKLKNFPERNVLNILDRLAVEFAEGSSRVTTRGIAFGSPSAGGGNTGNGTLNRLTVDGYAYELEAVTVEAKALKCIADRFSGAQVHQERFEIRGDDVPRDFVAGVVGRDRIGQLTCISSDDSQALVRNPSFSQYSGTAASPTAITGWTVTTDIANFAIVTSDTYRDARHEGDNAASVRFETNDTLTQKFSTLNPAFDPTVPYYCQIAFKRESSADGTLTLTVGGNSANVTLSAQSGWTILRLALDENLWFRQFNASDMEISIALASNTTGDVLVDDLVFAPMQRFDGSWWAPVGGATPFLLEDTFTVTDSFDTSDSILQKWLWRIYGRYLPHDTAASGNVTWSEPS